MRHAAAQIVSAIAATDKIRALQFVLNTDVGKDSALAERLFEIFEEGRGFDFTVITADEFTRLLGKLENVESVRSYHIGHFMLHAALRDPKAVARLLLARVQLKIKFDKERWEEPAADECLSAKQLGDNFGGLPESGFHEDKFQEVTTHADYSNALRLIRDAALFEESRSGLLYEDTLSNLFRDFSLNYCPASLDVLNEWINSGDCEKVQAAIHLLEDSYLGFYVNNLMFISNYLQRAEECGRGVFEAIEQAMLHSAEFGPAGVIASPRGEVSNALFHNALKALEQAKGDPLAVRFFQKLRDKGQQMIQSEMHRYAEEEIFARS